MSCWVRQEAGSSAITSSARIITGRSCCPSIPIRMVPHGDESAFAAVEKWPLSHEFHIQAALVSIADKPPVCRRKAAYSKAPGETQPRLCHEWISQQPSASLRVYASRGMMVGDILSRLRSASWQRTQNFSLDRKSVV